MDFRLTETQTLIADTVASLVDNHVQNTKAATGVGAVETSTALWPKLAELGLLGAEVGEVEGGSGGSFEDLSIILQGLGRAGGAGAFVPVVVMAAALIGRFGDDAQTANLPAIVEGHLKVVPAGFDNVGNMTSDSTPVIATLIDGGWQLTGRIAMVTAGDAADAGRRNGAWPLFPSAVVDK